MSSQKTEYRLVPRKTSKVDGKPLSSFALDITIRFNTDGSGGFIQDKNGDELAFNGIDEVKSLLNSEIDRNYTEHFGPKP